MNNYDPDAPYEGRLGSIMPNKRDRMSMKGIKMKFIPKPLCKKKDEREKETLNVMLKEEDQSLSEEEQGKMLMDLDQEDHGKIQIKVGKVSD
ncbi:hypothetical protein PCANB_001960 [Pneumocystis canis]|nr:hypothetical protein PCANB_001960 [Pneumocystis canis]